MIQRIQTVWMILALIAAILTFRFDTYTGMVAISNSYLELNAGSFFRLGLNTLILCILMAGAILLFKNRSKQKLLCILAFLYEGVVIFLYFREIRNFSTGNISLWAILHLAILAGIILALRGISNDQRLLKESDRLR